MPADRSGLKPRTQGAQERATRRAAMGLVSMKTADLSKEDVPALVSVVETIYGTLPPEAKDPAIVSSVLDAAVAAQPPGGGRRGGGVLTRSQAAIKETAEAGMRVLVATEATLDSTLTLVINKLPAAAIAFVAANGGVTVLANAIREQVVPLIPEPTSWASVVAEVKSAGGALTALAMDLSPLVQSPVGAMTVASLVMKYRAANAGKSVWDLIKSDASAMASGVAMGARGIGQAAQGKYYAMLSAYALEAQRKREATGADLMSAIAHLKPTVENKARIEAAEGLVEMGGPPRGGRRRKTKKAKRATRRRMPKFVY